MKNTSIFITLLTSKCGYKIKPEHKHLTIAVREDIEIVCDALRNEGASVKIVRIEVENGGREESILLREVEEESDQILYQLELDLTQSFITMKKFNELINGWSINDIG